MKKEIATSLSKGLAIFDVLIQIINPSSSSENWEAATVYVTQSGFQVEKKQYVVMSEKDSQDTLKITVPRGLSTQFTLTDSNGSTFFIRNATNRIRDTLVLTLRIFRSKFMIRTSHARAVHEVIRKGYMPSMEQRTKAHSFINGGYMPRMEQRSKELSSNIPLMHSVVSSFASEANDSPGIENFQIIGDAKPGHKLLGCGYPVHGVSTYMFQWVRHYPDGTTQFIDGAVNPDYTVTVDDIDKLISVVCGPIDDQGRQGDVVRYFANDHNKITCEEEMQEEIETYVMKGQANFRVLIRLDISRNWELATLLLTRSGFQVENERKEVAVVTVKYTKNLPIKIPSGLSTQFFLTCLSGITFFFSTRNNDTRMRDTIVLTMRLFQIKAFDEKRNATNRKTKGINKNIQLIDEYVNPDYIVTVDDVDKLISVVCGPIDDQGRQVDVVKTRYKITCEEEMQEEIETYVLKGQVTFQVLIRLDISENWELATLFLRRSGFQVELERKQDAVVTVKYSKELLIKIPSGLSTQFVLTCSSGLTCHFSTRNNDTRMPDIIVLTLKLFQSKAFDEKNQ